MGKTSDVPKLSPAPRSVPLAVRSRLIPFSFPFAIVLAIFAWFFWQLAPIAAHAASENDSGFLRWIAVGITVVGVVVLLSGLRTWFRRVRVLRHGEAVAAEILAIHSLAGVYKARHSWRHVDWKEKRIDRGDLRERFQDLKERWKSDDPHISWNGFGSALFQLRLPDDSIVVTACPASFEERLVHENYDVRDIAIYDPADPTNAILLGLAHPRLSVSSFGDWQLALGQSLPFGCLLGVIGVSAAACAFAWFLFT